jgi:hypothetical protein
VISVYILLGVLVASAAAMAVTRDLMDRKSRRRSGPQLRFDPTGARLGGPGIDLNPNLPHADRDR